MTVDLHCGDSLEVLRTFPDNTFDSVITDPPAGISFMGKGWDSDKGGAKEWIAWLTEIMAECLRVTKPGGSALVWSIPRTSHWTGTALEMAGWEVRDVVSHIFATGFPKSHDISKAIDRMAGAEREVIGPNPHSTPNRKPGVLHIGGANARPQMEARMREQGIDKTPLTAPATEAARVWDGWGSGGLKPAAEFWWLCQKPLQGTYAENALAWGVSGLAIDRARIPANGIEQHTTPGSGALGTIGIYGNANEILNSKQVARAEQGLNPRYDPSGRWPANLILQCLCDREDGTHDNPECVCAMLDAQSGERPSGYRPSGKRAGHKVTGMFFDDRMERSGAVNGYNDPPSGASRFFAQVKPDASRLIYAAKASRRERNAGLEGMPEITSYRHNNNGRDMSKPSNAMGDAERRRVERGEPGIKPAANHHPTVKSLSLMRYLCRLTSTPTGGSVLDPFMGSGSTGCAAVLEGRSFVGIDIDPEYVAIAEKRIAYWQAQAEAQTQAAQPMLLAAD